MGNAVSNDGGETHVVAAVGQHDRFDPKTGSLAFDRSLSSCRPSVAPPCAGSSADRKSLVTAPEQATKKNDNR